MGEPALHIILHNPKIPQNTGNIGRMCAVIGARLHLIHPMGFTITDAKLKRSGMDYWKSLDVVHHKNWEEFKIRIRAKVGAHMAFYDKVSQMFLGRKVQARRRPSIRRRGQRLPRICTRRHFGETRKDTAYGGHPAFAQPVNVCRHSRVRSDAADSRGGGDFVEIRREFFLTLAELTV